jgi:hypothetical protein
MSSAGNWDLKYLIKSQPPMFDLIYGYYPMIGQFDHSMFIPENLGHFYVVSILSGLIYSLILTLLTATIMSSGKRKGLLDF